MHVGVGVRAKPLPTADQHIFSIYRPYLHFIHDNDLLIVLYDIN